MFAAIVRGRGENFLDSQHGTYWMSASSRSLYQESEAGILGPQRMHQKSERHGRSLQRPSQSSGDEAQGRAAPRFPGLRGRLLRQIPFDQQCHVLWYG